MAGGLAGEDPIRADRQTPKGKRRWVLTAAGLQGRAGEGGRDGRSYTFIRFRAGKEGKYGKVGASFLNCFQQAEGLGQNVLRNQSTEG